MSKNNNLLYRFDPITKEFIGVRQLGDNQNAIPDPNEHTDKAPPAVKDGEVQLFNGDQWSVKKDHRGKTAYSTATKEELTVDYIGDLKTGHTFDRPLPFSNWENGKWVVDEEAKAEAEREHIATMNEKMLNRYREQLQEKIAPLADAVDLDIATKEEAEEYTQLRRLRVFLNRVPDQKEWPYEVEWPEEIALLNNDDEEMSDES